MRRARRCCASKVFGPLVYARGAPEITPTTVETKPWPCGGYHNVGEAVMGPMAINRRTNREFWSGPSAGHCQRVHALVATARLPSCGN